MRELIDFEGMTVPISQNIINQIWKNNFKNMRYELEKIMLMDFFKIEKILQNNLSKRNVELSSGVFDITRNTCIPRDLPLTKLTSDFFINQTWDLFLVMKDYQEIQVSQKHNFGNQEGVLNVCSKVIWYQEMAASKELAQRGNLLV